MRDVGADPQSFADGLQFFHQILGHAPSTRWHRRPTDEPVEQEAEAREEENQQQPAFCGFGRAAVGNPEQHRNPNHPFAEQIKRWPRGPVVEFNTQYIAPACCRKAFVEIYGECHSPSRSSSSRIVWKSVDFDKSLLLLLFFCFGLSRGDGFADVSGANEDVYLLSDKDGAVNVANCINNLKHTRIDSFRVLPRQ